MDTPPKNPIEVNSKLSPVGRQCDLTIESEAFKAESIGDMREASRMKAVKAALVRLNQPELQKMHRAVELVKQKFFNADSWQHLQSLLNIVEGMSTVGLKGTDGTFNQAMLPELVTSTFNTTNSLVKSLRTLGETQDLQVAQVALEDAIDACDSALEIYSIEDASGASATKASTGLQNHTLAPIHGSALTALASDHFTAQRRGDETRAHELQTLHLNIAEINGGQVTKLSQALESALRQLNGSADSPEHLQNMLGAVESVVSNPFEDTTMLPSVGRSVGEWNRAMLPSVITNACRLTTRFVQVLKQRGDHQDASESIWELETALQSCIEAVELHQ